MFLKLPEKFKWVRLFIGLAVIALAFLAILGAGSMRMDKDEIEVVGRIYVMGNEPFTQVGIKLDDGKVYALIGEYDKELRSLQGKRVVINGRRSGKTPRGAEAIKVKSFQVLETK